MSKNALLEKGTNSVLELSAQFKKLSQVVTCQAPGAQVTVNGQVWDFQKLGVLLYFVIIQKAGGLRVSDLLNLRPSDIMLPDSILVRQGKGSFPLLVRVPEISSVLLKWKAAGVCPFACYSRFSVYRMYKRCGFVTCTQGKINESVTHSFRKLKARELYAQSADISVSQLALGHRNVKSTESYVENKKNDIKKRGTR